MDPDPPWPYYPFFHLATIPSRSRRQTSSKKRTDLVVPGVEDAVIGRDDALEYPAALDQGQLPQVAARGNSVRRFGIRSKRSGSTSRDFSALQCDLLR